MNGIKKLALTAHLSQKGVTYRPKRRPNETEILAKIERQDSSEKLDFKYLATHHRPKKVVKQENLEREN